MKKSMNIGIDVDLTWVDSGSPWLTWMEQVYGVSADWGLPPANPQGKIYYNLAKYFPDPKKKQIPPFEYWEDPYLYDKLEPYPGAVGAVRKFVEAGHKIHFISYCKKGHFSSKARHLERHTGDFMTLDGSEGHGFYATKNKSGILVDVIIDDRNNFLNQFGDEVLKIKFSTCYDQEVDLKRKPDLETNDWRKISDFVLDIA